MKPSARYILKPRAQGNVAVHRTIILRSYLAFLQAGKKKVKVPPPGIQPPNTKITKQVFNFNPIFF
ncbi:MAG: hypothetical protein Q6365_007500, partial [Candidatus Sigynarchaeota archaeon]